MAKLAEMFQTVGIGAPHMEAGVGAPSPLTLDRDDGRFHPDQGDGTHPWHDVQCIRNPADWAGGFFWLDLENPGDDELAEFCHSLQLSADAIDSVTHASQRSSFALAAGSVQAVLPAAAGTQPAAWLEASYVTLLLTEQFLLTVHAAPSPALQHGRHKYRGLDDEDARADEVRLLFLVTDILIGSFRH